LSAVNKSRKSKPCITSHACLLVCLYVRLYAALFYSGQIESNCKLDCYCRPTDYSQIWRACLCDN